MDFQYTKHNNSHLNLALILSMSTLQIPSSDTRIFLAAMSRWIKDFIARYVIPQATCLE